MNGVAITTSSEVAKFAHTKQRQPEEAHPRRPHRDDRHEEVERRHDRGGARELDRRREKNVCPIGQSTDSGA